MKYNLDFLVVGLGNFFFLVLVLSFRVVKRIIRKKKFGIYNYKVIECLKLSYY